MSKKESKKVYCYKKNTKELIAQYNSTYEASKKTGIDQSNISKNCRKEISSIGNYIFSYFKLENADTTKSNNNVDRLYNAWIDKIDWQRVEMFARDIKNTDYENRLNQFEEKVNFIYKNIDDDDECYNELSYLKYEFMTWWDYEEIVLKKENYYMNKYKNEYLLLDYEN